MAGPARVLQIVGKMDRGGIETWLMHLLRRVDPSEFAFDFLVETADPGAFDSEILGLGARIIHCERTRRLLSYRRRLTESVVQFGPYTIVHSHAALFSGFTLAVAARAGVPMRIAHSHTDMRLVGRGHDPLRYLYYTGLRAALTRYMTHGIAVSDGAAQDLFGSNYKSDKRVQVLPCGIDYSPFLANSPRFDARAELTIPRNAKVVGHVGRFEPEKNHRLLVDAFTIAAQHDQLLHLLLVGDGRLRTAVETRVREVGLQNRVIFAGVRSDVSRMLAAMDAFAFPSKFEGLGLALVEAEAAGLPIVVSDSIPGDALIPNHSIRRLPLTDPNVWAAAILQAVNLPGEARSPSISQKFDVDNNLRELLSIYRSAS